MNIRLQRCALLLTGLCGLGTVLVQGCDGGTAAKPSDGGAKSNDGGLTGDAGLGPIPGSGGAGGGVSGSGQPSPGLAAGACLSDKSCTASGKVCDLTRMLCVACVRDTDCGDAGVCTANACATAATACTSAKNCPGAVCHSTLQQCVDCEGNNDCDTGSVCNNMTCRVSCTADTDCTAKGLVCDLAKAYCVACTADSSCTATEYCSSQGTCVKHECEPGSAGCLSNQVLTCDARGAGYTAKPCTTGTCSETGGAHCGEGGAETDGSVVDPGACNVVGDPCTSIPKFTGTQVIDGIGDEFCTVPGKTFNLSSAAFVEPTGAQNGTSKATVRAAWSADALHIHVHVDDPNVIVSGGDAWNGDNVQLFIAGVAPTSPTMDGKANGGANQIFLVPPSGALPGKASTPQAGPSYKSASRLVDGGYEVELLWPWIGIPAARAAGDQIGFDMMVGVQDFAQSGGREFQYGMYCNQSVGAGDAACVNLYLNAMLWCTPKLQ